MHHDRHRRNSPAVAIPRCGFEATNMRKIELALAFPPPVFNPQQVLCLLKIIEREASTRTDPYRFFRVTVCQLNTNLRAQVLRRNSAVDSWRERTATLPSAQDL